MDGATLLRMLHPERYRLYPVPGSDGVLLVDDEGYILDRDGFAELSRQVALGLAETDPDEIAALNARERPVNRGPATLARPHPPRDCSGYVYLLEGDHGYYKIGKAKDVTSRLAVIEPALPFSVELLHSIQTDDADRLERYLHRRYAYCRTNGEWFKLDAGEVDHLQQQQIWCLTYEDLEAASE